MNFPITLALLRSLYQGRYLPYFILRIAGQTADRLLIINEAQDVRKGIYDKCFAPMAAAGNATRLFSGTAWTGDTLLEREKRSALELEKRDGLKRVFVVTGEQVARHNRRYAVFLKNEIRKMGRDHPLIRTQYFCENIEGVGGMFTAAHRALMSSDQSALRRGGFQPPSPMSTTRVGDVAFLLDIAGQEESTTSFDPNTLAGGIEPDLNGFFPLNRVLAD